MVLKKSRIRRRSRKKSEGKRINVKKHSRRNLKKRGLKRLSKRKSKKRSKRKSKRRSKRTSKKRSKRKSKTNYIVLNRHQRGGFVIAPLIALPVVAAVVAVASPFALEAARRAVFS